MPPVLPHRQSPLHLRPSRVLSVLTVMAAMSGLVLTGCSTGGGTTTSAQSGVASAPAQGGANVKGAPGFSATDSSSAKPAREAKFVAPVVGNGQKLTKSASLELQVKNIDTAAVRVRAIATGLRAQIVSEQLGQGSPGGPVPLQESKKQSDAVAPGDVPEGGASGALTLSVPADKLDAALDQLAPLGTVLRRSTSSEDVTSQYVDTASRVKTMRASVTRVRALLAQAKDIGQIVAVEGELSQREADLESLESQLSALTESVARSTLTVSLSTKGNAPETTTGFVAGLRSGWNAFTASASGLLTAIGAALPFIIFFALGGVPLWLLRRRLHLSVGSASEVKA